MKRKFDPSSPEWMDCKTEPDSELLEDLQNLRRLNALFGAHRLVLRHFQSRLHSGQPWEIIDLATGYGDIPRELIRWCRRNNICAHIEAVDANPATLEIAAAASRHFPEISFRQADMRCWQPTHTPDFVMCNLALHHFSEEDAVEILRRCRDSGAKSILISDLQRGFFLKVGVHLLTTVWLRAPMTRNDARVSVERAFSKPELSRLLIAAGWEGFELETVEFVRQAAWLDSK